MFTVPEIFSENLKKQYYTPERLKEWMNDIGSIPFVKKRGKEYYANIPASFDIETTSSEADGEKAAWMYEWTLNIWGLNMIGRTWEELNGVLFSLSKKVDLGKDRILVVYVHNLAFEFQFLRKRFKWANVFSLDVREPVKTRTEFGIEFRCSYKLSGYSLAKIGEMLTKFDIKKAVGDLDYNLIRHSKTPLTDTEINYCVQDCNVVSAFIMEEILRNRNLIINIPLTKTGYVRRYCRKECTREGGHKRSDLKQYLYYRGLMNSLTLDVAEYDQLKRAFAGGFTHCSAWHSMDVLENVTSYDFTSSYPAVLLSEQFPMSRSECIPHITKDIFSESLKNYCCLFNLKLFGVKSKNTYEHIISASKCGILENAKLDNGRVVSADVLCITVTEVDYVIIKNYYKFEKMQVANFRRYVKGYLPKNLILSILKLYSDKTTLKGVDGKEEEYLWSKEQLNGCYGMMVTDICRDDILYDDDWSTEMCDKTEAIDAYNSSKSRFLFYPWGVWCTAYARRNLIRYGIFPVGGDYVYSDTDSVKLLKACEHQETFLNYNKIITAKIHEMCKHWGIDESLTRPKTIKGIEKPIGVWDADGEYRYFKSLGAKRYLVQYPDGEVSLTVSGLNKKTVVPYLLEKLKIPYHVENRGGSRHYIADGDITALLNHFDDDLYIPAGKTGKNTHSYIDFPQSGIVKDYLGIYGEFTELSSVHISPADYSLSMPELYIKFIMEVKNYET